MFVEYCFYRWLVAILNSVGEMAMIKIKRTYVIVLVGLICTMLRAPEQQEQQEEPELKTKEELQPVFDSSYADEQAFKRWFNETPTYGDLYLAEYLYHDWATSGQCSTLQGQICPSVLCAGAHYTDEYCCCKMKYNKPRPTIDQNDLIAAGVIQS